MFETTLLAVGASQGMFLTLALIAKETSNRGATRSLAGLVGLFTALALGQLLGIAWPDANLGWIAFVNVNAELAIGPLLLLFVRYLFEPERSWRLRDTVQLLPFAAGIGLWGGLYVSMGIRGIEPSLARYAGLALGFVIFKAAVFYGYLFRVFATLRQELARSQRVVAGRQQVQLGWLVRWVRGIGVAATVLYALVFLDAAAPHLAIDTDLFANLILVGMLYLISAMALLRPWVLSARPRPRPDERLADDVARVESWLAHERPYLDPDLTLRDLAAALGLSENRLSAVLNEGLGTGFYDLVSRYRLAHFERLAADRELRERTVLDLAFESGFNSKASFYRSFRSTHETTPTAFRKLQLD